MCQSDRSFKDFAKKLKFHKNDTCNYIALIQQNNIVDVLCIHIVVKRMTKVHIIKKYSWSTPPACSMHILFEKP